MQIWRNDGWSFTSRACVLQEVELRHLTGNTRVTCIKGDYRQNSVLNFYVWNLRSESVFELSNYGLWKVSNFLFLSNFRAHQIRWAFKFCDKTNVVTVKFFAFSSLIQPLLTGMVKYHYLVYIINLGFYRLKYHIFISAHSFRVKWLLVITYVMRFYWLFAYN